MMIFCCFIFTPNVILWHKC